MVPMSVPVAASRALFLPGAGAGAACGQMVLVRGAAAGRALLLGQAASARLALLPVGGASKASLLRLCCTAGAGGWNLASSDDDADKSQDLGEEDDALGVVVHGDEEMLDLVATMAKEAGDLLSMMTKEAPAPIPDSIHQELGLVTAAFKEVEENCELGHVTEKSITAATAGLKKMADVFVGTGAGEVADALGVNYMDGDGASYNYKEMEMEDEGEGAGHGVKKKIFSFSVLLRTVRRMYLGRAHGWLAILTLLMSSD